MDIRGLTLFISDIRKNATKTSERQRVDKELAKIRKYFNDPKLKGYDRKKCVSKLLYIFMLGYNIDFGHIQAINLLASTKYSEKHIGYLACSLLLDEDHEMLRLITERCRVDLNSRNPAWQCMSLTCIGNIGGKEQSEALIQDVKRILLGSDTHSLVRKKAALTLLRLYRKFPELLPPDDWINRLINLLSLRDLGVITSLMSLLLTLASDNPEEYKICISKVIRLLVSLVINKQYLAKYIYYGIPAPWLQVKLLRILQYYPLPTDSAMLTNLNSVIKTNIEKSQRLTHQERTKSTNRYNALHAVFFEALNLAIHYDANEKILTSGCEILLGYINSKEPNLKYLSLDTLSRLAYSKFGEVRKIIYKKQRQILECLKDVDISIRRRALDVLYSMCTKANADQIVGELIEYLPLSDYAIREELVLKIAILAEKFAGDLTWYVDVILNIIREAGDFVTDDIWFRVCQLITNKQDDEELQTYAAKTIFNNLQSPSAHEVLVKVAGYVLGEYGDLIVDEYPPMKQFKVLCNKFETSSMKTRVILADTFIKMFNLYEDEEELRTKITALFEKYRENFNIEIQQRSNEYIMMINKGDEDFMDKIFDAIPVFNEGVSSVLKKLLEKKKSVTDSKIRAGKDIKEIEEAVKKTKTEELDMPNAESEGEEDSEEEGEDSEEEEGEETTEQPNLLDLGGDILQPPKKQDTVHEKEETEKKSNSGGGLLDFFETKEEPSPKKESSPAGGILDFFNTDTKPASVNNTPGAGVVDFFDNTTTTENPFEKKKKELQEKIRQNHFKMLTSQLGTLLESDLIQIKIKQQFKENKGRVALYYKNQTSQTLNIKVVVNKIEELKMDNTPVTTIAPSSEVSQFFKILCIAPFTGMPSFKLECVTQMSEVKEEIKFPISVHKFFQPHPIGSKDEFFNQWAALESEESKQIQTTFMCKKNGVNSQHVRELVKGGFNMKVYKGIVDDQTSVVAGSKFYSSGGNSVVLVRIQMNSKKMAVRVTSKCIDPIVNEVFHKLIKEQIEEM